MQITNDECKKWLLNKNINPKTGRSIQTNKGVWLRFNKECNDVLKKKESTPKKIQKDGEITDNECVKWLSNKNINPKTGRKIQSGKGIWLKFNKRCESMNIKISPPKRVSPPKKISPPRNKSIESGFHSIIGRRKEMEDTHIIVDDLYTIDYNDELKGASLYAVFDGHGGKTVSDLLTYSFTDELCNKLISISSYRANMIEEAIEETYLYVDEMLLNNVKDTSGSTCVSALIIDGVCYISNIGDSECIIKKRNDTGYHVMSELHKPDIKSERERIQSVGGLVIGGRLVGDTHSISVSRAFGDKEYKMPLVKKLEGVKDDLIISSPYISQIASKEVEFIILACDGLFEAFTHREAFIFVNNLIKNGETPDKIAKKLVDEAYRKGSMDNISAIIVIPNQY